MKVEIYSDISCPWCYIGEKRFATALASYADRDVDVSFRPYQLDPEAPTDPRPLTSALREKFGANVQQMLDRVAGVARGEGIEMHWDKALAASVGMEAQRVQRYLDSDEGLAETRAEIEQARATGVRAVPTFVFDGQYVVEGGQPAAVFSDVLREVARLEASEDEPAART